MKNVVFSNIAWAPPALYNYNMCVTSEEQIQSIKRTNSCFDFTFNRNDSY